MTLKGIAQKWFNGLPNHCIHNFFELQQIFTHHFMANSQERKISAHLSNIVQKDCESLRSYVQRFTNETLLILGLSDQVTYDHFLRGLHPYSSFKFVLVRRKCTTLQDALNEAENYIHAQELCRSIKRKMKVNSLQIRTNASLSKRSRELGLLPQRKKLPPEEKGGNTIPLSLNTPRTCLLHTKK